MKAEDALIIMVVIMIERRDGDDERTVRTDEKWRKC